MKNSKVINYYNDKGLILKSKDFKIYSVYCKISEKFLRVGDNSNYGKILGFDCINNSPTTSETIVLYQCRGSWKWLTDVTKVNSPSNFKNKNIIVDGVKSKFISEGHYLKFIMDIKHIRQLTLIELVDYFTTPIKKKQG